MKFKKLLIPAILSISVLGLASCDLENFFKDFFNDNVSIPTIDENTEGDTADEEDNTYTPVDIDETNLDYGYLDLQKYDSKKEQLIGLYTDIDTVCSEFMTSTADLTPTTKTVGSETKTYYIIGEQICYSTYGLSYEEAAACYKAVILDNPEYYFLSNTLLTSSTTSTKLDDSFNPYEVTTSYITLVCDADYINHTTRATYNQNIADYDATIKTLIADMTNPVLKVKTIHDYIVNNARYAFKSDGVTPDDSSFAHNLLGIIVNQKGVCESYSELFHYLLKNNGIESIIVTGMGYPNGTESTGEGHAWNYVKFNYEVDGEPVEKWYGFDVTWDDPVVDSGVQMLSYDCFGRVDEEFTSTHISDTNGDLSTGIYYLYALPTLADSNLVY